MQGWRTIEPMTDIHTKAVLKERIDAAFDNMEGCDHDEFIRWEATYVALREVYEELFGKYAQ